MLNFRGTQHWRTSLETLERDTTMSLSSAEAEAKAITKGVEGIYARNLLEGLTSETHNLERWRDGSRACAISQKKTNASRSTDNVDTTSAKTKRNEKSTTIRGDENEADVLTTRVPGTLLDKLSNSLRYWFVDE